MFQIQRFIRCSMTVNSLGCVTEIQLVVVLTVVILLLMLMMVVVEGWGCGWERGEIIDSDVKAMGSVSVKGLC